MLNGKNWPRAVWGFRMLSSGLVLRAMIDDLHLDDTEKFEEAMTSTLERASESSTGRLWVDGFIKPVTIVHQYLRAEREGDWLLHHYCLREMLPYFIIAGHWNYARYIAIHVHEMGQLTEEGIKAEFLKGRHVCRHNDGLLNAVFQDQFGEQTMIMYGKGRSGITGRTLSTKQRAEWVVTHPILQRMAKLMENMFVEDKCAIIGNDSTSANPTDSMGTTEATNIIPKHKEEGTRRRKIDADDRHLILCEIDSHDNRLTLPKDSPLQNVVNGRTASKNVNSHNCLEIGTKLVKNFMDSLPQGFYTCIKKTWCH